MQRYKTTQQIEEVQSFACSQLGTHRTQRKQIHQQSQSAHAECRPPEQAHNRRHNQRQHKCQGHKMMHRQRTHLLGVIHRQDVPLAVAKVILC